jgi:hypothetical protein
MALMNGVMVQPMMPAMKAKISIVTQKSIRLPDPMFVRRA